MVVPMDAYRDGDQFVVQLDLPGVEPSAIEVNVQHNFLTVRAERGSAHPEGVSYQIAERAKGPAVRELFLGDTLDTEKIEAAYDAGVLTLRIPVSERAKPRRIPIDNRGGARAIESDPTS
ncbi:Hsp20/alpha crystallin family protein [Pseudonocardia sp. N23]|uniref:Hsp20/alpha crystallin family protein n=1 Tax=Pseudonocardia sp. N23 TaxID=1987376 RepID=UPI0035B5E77D